MRVMDWWPYRLCFSHGRVLLTPEIDNLALACLVYWRVSSGLLRGAYLLMERRDI